MNLAEALTHYLSAAKSNVSSYAHQELHRFGRAVGLEREVEHLRPPEVAGYAEKVVTAGGDVHGRLTPVKEFLAFLKKHGLSAHSLAPHVKIPRATARHAAATARAFEQTAMTAEGISALQEELDGLKNQRVDIVEAIKIAAADKDFRENAPLDAAKDAQGQAEGRIRQLEEMLRRAVVLEKNAGQKGARVGSTVVLQDLASGSKLTYTLVNTAEADPTGGKLSIDSPVGGAVAGAIAGTEVAVQAPKGERKYKVVSVDG